MSIDVTSPPEVADDPPLPSSSSPIPSAQAPAVSLVTTTVIHPRRRKWVPRTAPVVGEPGAFAPHIDRLRLRDLHLPVSLQHAPYRRFWSGQIVALFGIWAQNTAAQLVILSLTSSAFLVGAINIVSAVPLLLLSLVGGVVADRFDRRRIIMSTQLLVASLSVAWALLIFTDRIAYWHVLVLAALGGTIASFDMPAGQAFFAQIVRREDMPEAIALNSMSVNATRSVGPAIAGLVIGIFGTAVAFVSHSLALVVFVGVIFSVGKLMPQSVKATAREPGLAALKAGLRCIQRSDELIGLVGTTALFSFFAVPGLLVLMPLFVTRTLGGGDGWVPAMTSVFGLGSLCAAVIVFRSGRHELAAGRRLRLTALGIAAGLLWLAVSPTPWLAIPGVLISGLCFEMGLIQIQTRLQQLAPDDMRGRVLSVNGLAFNGVMPIATLSISGASTALGLPIVLGGCGAALAMGSYAIWRRFTWKAFLPPEPIPIVD